jgi:hypothetical protein
MSLVLSTLKTLRWAFYTLRAAAAEVLGKSVRVVRLALALPGAPRPGDKFICKRWLGRTLRASGVIPGHARVASVEVRSLDGNRGFIGVMSRVSVTYEPACPGAPATFVLKMSRPG